MKRRVIWAVALSSLVIILGVGALYIVSRYYGKDKEAISLETTEPMQDKELSGQASENREELKADETEKKTEIIEVTISAAGDVTLGNTQLQGYEGTFIEQYDKKGSEYFLSDVRSVFSKDDMTLVNFEGVLTEATKKMPKEFNLKGRPEFMQILNDGSVECVAFANNHRMDYYEKGSDETVEGFKQYGITYAYDEKTAIYEVKGIKIGYISVNTSHDEEVLSYVEDGINELKKQGAQAVIVYIHWGIELDHYPQKKHTELGHKFIDMGADIVLGAHPHVLQGIEIYNGKPIVYSLGNFCFGGNKNPKRKNSMIYQQVLTFVNGEFDGKLNAKVIPCTISSVDNRNDFCPTIQSGERKLEILKELRDYSKGFGTKIGKDGELLVE